MTTAQLGGRVSYQGKEGPMTVYVNVRNELRHVDRYGQPRPVRLEDLAAYAEAVATLAKTE